MRLFIYGTQNIFINIFLEIGCEIIHLNLTQQIVVNQFVREHFCQLS